MEPEQMIDALAQELADIHTYAQNVAKRFFPAEKVEGDSYGVPSTEDIIDMIVTLIPTKGGESNGDHKA